MKRSVCIHCGARIALRTPDMGEASVDWISPVWLDGQRINSDYCTVDEDGRSADGERFPFHSPNLEHVVETFTRNPAIDRLVGLLVGLAITALFIFFLVQATA